MKKKASVSPFLRKSLIEAGIGAGLGGTVAGASALVQGEKLKDVGFEVAGSGIAGAAGLAGLGQALRVARVTGALQKNLRTNTRYNSLATEIKNLESRRPVVLEQLKNWDDNTRLNDALANYMKAPDPFVKKRIGNIRFIRRGKKEEGASSLLYDAKALDRIEEQLESRIRKLYDDDTGTRTQEIKDLGKDLKYFRDLDVPNKVPGDARKKMELAQVPDIDYRYSKMRRGRRKDPSQSKVLYGTSSYEFDPTIRMENKMISAVRKSDVGKANPISSYPALVTDQQAYMFKKGPSHKIHLTPRGIIQKGHGPNPDLNFMVDLVNVPKGTPAKKLKSLRGGDRDAFTFTRPVFDYGQDGMGLNIQEKVQPSGVVDYNRAASPVAKQNAPMKTTSETIQDYQTYAMDRQGITGKKKQINKRINVLKDEKRNLGKKLSGIRDIRRQIQSEVKEQKNLLMEERRRPREAVEEMQNLKDDLRSQLENDIYGKWFGVF